MDSITTRRDAWSVVDDDESELLDLMVAYAPAYRPRARIGAEPTGQPRALTPAAESTSTLGHLTAAFESLSPGARAGVVLAALVFAGVALGWIVGLSAKTAAMSAAAL